MNAQHTEFKITRRSGFGADSPELLGFSPTTMDALTTAVGVLDEEGVILATNEAWRNVFAESRLTPQNAQAGANYLTVCDGLEAEDAASFAEGIRRVARGDYPSFTLEYPGHAPGKARWFLGRATREPDAQVTRVVVVHENITARKEAEQMIDDQLAEILRWQRVMLGREHRVQELKAEVNALLAAERRPGRYPSQDPP